MTKDKIIEMAREAGGTTNGKIWAMYPAELEAFANLVAQHERKEALAQPEQEPDAYGYAKRLADAIWKKHYKQDYKF
jgi:hypothetical protein